MDVTWLAQEARTLHGIFSNLFLTLTLTLLTLGILCEYFKMPIGGIPQFPMLVGRAFVACVLWAAMPEIMNMLSAVTDAFAKEIGSLIQFKYVLSRLSDKFKEMSFSWVSFKDSVMILVSYLTFFLLYITVYLADAFFLFTWMMLYIFAPILIGMFVLPITSGATTKLFRSLIEVCLWKIVWCCLSALLWSMALSKINDPGTHINFLTAIVLNLMLAFSVILTPMLTSSFLNSGVSTVANGFGSVLLQAARLTPQGMTDFAKSRIMTHSATAGQRTLSGVSDLGKRISTRKIKSVRKAQRLNESQHDWLNKL